MTIHYIHHQMGPLQVCKRANGSRVLKRWALAGIPGLFKPVDDILIQGCTKKELIDRVEDIFRHCLENQITLSNCKHQVGQNVKFSGHVITDQGTKPDPVTVAAIKDYPEPDNFTDLQSFMGLANRFGEYSPDLRHAMEPLRLLLKKKNAYAWIKDHTEAMNKVKNIITGPQCLQRFDPELETVLLTEASRKGLGFILIQTETKPEGNEDKLADLVTKHTAKKIPKSKLVSCDSRFLSSSESNYTMIHCSKEWITNSQKHCRVKPKWFLDL